jgi:hypothetical protein
MQYSRWRGFIFGLHLVTVVLLLFTAARVTWWPIPGEFDSLTTPFWLVPVSLVVVAGYGAFCAVRHFSRWQTDAR